MNLDQLRYLVALDEERHFTRAAERVFLTQPALSIQIKRLEEELGVVLFHRKKRPLEPTEVGEQVIVQARKVLEEVERLKALARGEEGFFQGPFRLGVIPTLAPYLLPRLLPRLRVRFPGLELSVREEPTPSILQGLVEGRLDAGLIATEEEAPGLEVHPLFREAFLAYVSPEHPLYARTAIHPLEIPLEDTWVLAEGHCFREQVLAACRPGQGSKGVEFQSGDLETLIRLVEEVGGLTLLPEVAIWTLPKPKKIHLRPLSPPGAGRTVYLILRQGALKRPVALRLGEEGRALALALQQSGHGEKPLSKS
ncbi:LysR family transcriptional regulator [Meiothermus ruber]|jgi:LysR family hydrogen peroxide-inducible transcriptional activator|uniref:LysR family transcriptional regulator n=1 Tax=Meiothermus ruber (strain ATCC 35948 / DSM 1279 / VKM B-1258 / 21) TaxID=504728 RepID=D3PQI5_MEIRD|nr:hydrogen peroxide-inducible genes activator [Meiothermus ruber]ADD27718.1 transcriptional regulator, LysR family [Meiothermus ruber DSM 1279]AGK04183.1 LysR family transcriptional regulator [Meiothermus ruber DSM 1279]MCL6531069.1 LysR family transcriptional regulator [Meiothermus ruber]GAO74646.1 LysR family transcriptional regulator [Meiothermus ruber H328]